ncbi:hypothetical protein MJ904_22395 [Massilia sp. MB5]|uniref:hypothetical protein n=1 Tax=Massilia sp. MB5 TaxID=2919578 RepID=UPI001F104C4E|nr:hypothetical protein [Massilia sp. MB5]UMR29760.1 hypothetical protein MJ904_22395 [Massilia sp. MB5]
MNLTDRFELTINGTPPDMVGAICEGFVCESLRVEGEPPASANTTYLKFHGSWYRLYFEFRCIFWRRFEELIFPWEDETPWTDHVNITDEFEIVGQRLVSCAVSATDEGSEVAFAFENRLTVLIQDRNDRASYSIADYTHEGKRN